MADRLTLEVLTPQSQVLTVETPWVTIPGAMGELGVLPEHVPLVTTIDSGILQYEENGQRQRAAVHYGYAQVRGNHVLLLAEMVEFGVHIDRRRAENAERRAREELHGETSEQSETRERAGKYEAKLKRALVRQQASML